MARTVKSRSVSLVALNRVGRLDLRDLHAISEFYGREFMPYPFMRRQLDGGQYDASSAPDRFKHGDLRVFKQWFTSYMSADIWVETNVQYLGSDTPSLRMLAHRSGEYGFLAIQNLEDAIEVFTLSPYDLGRAVAGSTGLTKAGKHSKIVIPEYIPRPAGSSDQVDASGIAPLMLPGITAATGASVPQAKVSAYATVQSHWRPARYWGLDRYKHAAVWVRVNDDGEYLYVTDGSHATPMTARSLSERIDQLIGEDVASLKEFRGRRQG